MTQNPTNFNVEIAHVIGEQLAKQAIASYDQEELNKLVKGSIQYLTTTESESSFHRHGQNRSKLQQMITDKLFTCLKEKVDELVASEEHQKAMQELSQTIMDDVLADAKTKMVDILSDKLANFTVSPHGSISNMMDDYMRQLFANRPRY